MSLINAGSVLGGREAAEIQAQIAAASPPRKYPAGVWSNQHVAYISTSATYSGSYFMLFTVPHSITINEFGLAFYTDVAGRRARVRFYTEAGVAVSSVFDFDAAATYPTTAAPLTLPAGRYLLGLAHSGTGTASNLRNINALACEPLPVPATASPNFGGGSTGYQLNEVFANSLVADISTSLPFLTQITTAQPAVFMLIS